MKRIFGIVALVLVVALAAGTAFGAPKIGIVTGTVAQGEEEYRAGEEAVAKYGKDRVVHLTYPVKFMDEQETTISQIVSLAADDDLKAIVVCQAVPGVAAAIDKVREFRDDVVFVLGVPHEKFEIVSAKADVLYEINQPVRGRTIVEKAKQMGAKTFVHISFPRHMSYAHLANRRDIMKETAGKIGVNFVEVTAPDPMAEGGVAASQQFVLEDIPRQVLKYGKDTAFFSTNCAMQEPLIKSVIKTGAIAPEQCDPSPYHGLPNALGIQIPSDKAGDVSYILKAINDKVTEQGGAGRISTWTVPAVMTMVRAGVQYGWAYADGKIAAFDSDCAIQALRDAGGNVIVEPREGTRNFFYFVGEDIIFGTPEALEIINR